MQGMKDPKETGCCEPGGAPHFPSAQVLGAGHWGSLPPRDTCLLGLVAAGAKCRQVCGAVRSWGWGLTARPLTRTLDGYKPLTVLRRPASCGMRESGPTTPPRLCPPHLPLPPQALPGHLSNLRFWVTVWRRKVDSPSWGPFLHPCVWASSPATTHTESRPRSPRSGPSWPRVSAERPLHALRVDPVFGCGEGEPGDWTLGCPGGRTRAAPSSTAAGAGPAGTLQLQPPHFPGACSSQFGGRVASPCAGTRGPRGRPGR